MQKNKVFFKVILFVLLSSLSIGCTVLSDSKNQKPINHHTSYVSDFNNTYNKNSVKQQTFKQLIDPKIGYKNGTYWFKVMVDSTLIGKKIVFTIDGNTIEKVTLYNQDKQLNFVENNLKNHQYKFNTTQNNSLEYYFKIHFQKNAFFPLKIDTEEAYQQNTNRFYLTTGLYYGFACIVIALNLFFYSTLKDKTFLAYILFLLFTSVGLTEYDGLMALFVSPNQRYYISIALHVLVPLGSALFTFSLLQHHKFVPKSKFIASALLALGFIFYLLFIYTTEFLYFAIGDLFGLGLFTYIMYLGIYELKRQKTARFTVLGYSLIWFSGLFFVIPLNWGITIFSLPLESVKIGSLFEMIILTYAITYRVKILHQENKDFQIAIKKHIEQVSLLEEKVSFIANEFKLTEREAAILLSISNGKKNQQIADELFISINTIKYHTKKLYEKLGVKKRTEITSKILLEH